MPDQLSLFAAFDRPLFNIGWLQCPCGLVFWVWPTATGLTPAHCTGRTGVPDIRPLRAWTCQNGQRRMTSGARR